MLFLMFMGWLNTVLSRLNGCFHYAAQPVVGKTYCPDCGQGIVYEWWLLRCSGCSHYRKARWVLGKLYLLQRFCVDCGHQGYLLERYTEPPIYHLDFVLLRSIPVGKVQFQAHLEMTAFSFNPIEKQPLKSLPSYKMPS